MKAHLLFPGFIVLIILLPLADLYGQWIPCQGIVGASVNGVLVKSPNVFISCSGNGIYKKPVDEPVWDTSYFFGSYDNIKCTGEAIFIHGTWGFYRSIDNGLNWESYDDILSVVYDCGVVDESIFILLDIGVIQRSDDEGVTWTDVTPAVPVEYGSLFDQDGALFFVDLSQDLILKTEDFGANWVIFPANGLDSLNIREYDVFEHHNRIYLGSNYGLYEYNQDSLKWFVTSDSILQNASIRSFHIVGETLCCCTNRGYYWLDETMNSWEADNEGLPSLSLVSASVCDSLIYVATAEGPAFKTPSSSWTADYAGLFQKDISQVFNIDSTIYALSSSRIYYSNHPADGFEILEAEGFCATNRIEVTDSLWYAGSSCGFLASADSGRTWYHLADSLPEGSIRAIAINQDYYFAEGYLPTRGLYRTLKADYQWELVPNGLATANVWDIFALDSVVFARVYGETGLYRSTDNGTSFTPVPEGGAYAPILYIENGLVYLLVDFLGVYLSRDSGYSWNIWLEASETDYYNCMDISGDTALMAGMNVYIGPTGYMIKLYSPEYPGGLEIEDNLPLSSYPFISDVLIQDGRLFAAPDHNSLWYRDDFMTGIPEHAGLDSHLSILKVFPNPGSGQLNIEIDGNFNRQQAALEICSYNGMVVCHDDLNLSDGIISMDISGLSDGLYFIRVIGPENSFSTVKFIKVR